MSAEVPGDEPEEEAGSLPPPKPSLWRQLALGLVILVCGIVIGASGGLLLGKRLWHPPRDPMPRDVMPRMTERLNLTPEQQKQIGQIVSKRLVAVAEIRKEMRPRIGEQMQLMQSEVAEVLNAEQKAEWRRWFREVQRARPGAPPGWPRGGPDGRQRGRDGFRGPRPGQPGAPGNGRERPDARPAPTDAQTAPPPRPSPPISGEARSPAAAGGSQPVKAPRETKPDSR
jgi:hypothetical protein